MTANYIEMTAKDLSGTRLKTDTGVEILFVFPVGFRQWTSNWVNYDGVSHRSKPL